MEWVTKLVRDREIKCECGDTAIFDYISFEEVSEDVVKVNIHYWCWHKCDKITTKSIEICIAEECK